MEKSLQKIKEEVCQELLERGTHATREEIETILDEGVEEITQNKDATIEELIGNIMRDAIEDLDIMRRKYPSPGYTAGFNMNNINVKLYGGNINFLGEPMPENALFDIASSSKFYTLCTAYNMIRDGYFDYDSKIKDLDPRFKNVGDLTVGDVTTFTTTFRTDGRIDDKNNKEEAIELLYNMNVVQTGEYNYNDMGVMLLKEMMEKVSGEKYEDLLKRYVLEPLNLKETHLIVPTDKIKLVTGTPNASLGKVNDPKAVILGGFSGHAGVLASSDDLLKLKGVFHNDNVHNISDAYTHGIKTMKGIMGSTYTTHEKGMDATYAGRTTPNDTAMIQGSTKVFAAFNKDSAWNFLPNPGSMGTERALKEQERVNKRREENGQNKLELVKTFEVNEDGKIVSYELIDSRQLLPDSISTDKMIKNNEKIMLKLRLLDHYLKEYHKYEKDINLSIKGNKR